MLKILLLIAIGFIPGILIWIESQQRYPQWDIIALVLTIYILGLCIAFVADKQRGNNE